VSQAYFRFHREHEHLSLPFGEGASGRRAEHIARYFGTPKYILGQYPFTAHTDEAGRPRQRHAPAPTRSTARSSPNED
jgi:hypothetical protein